MIPFYGWSFDQIANFLSEGDVTQEKLREKPLSERPQKNEKALLGTKLAPKIATSKNQNLPCQKGQGKFSASDFLASEKEPVIDNSAVANSSNQWRKTITKTKKSTRAPMTSALPATLEKAASETMVPLTPGLLTMATSPTAASPATTASSSTTATPRTFSQVTFDPGNVKHSPTMPAEGIKQASAGAGEGKDVESEGQEQEKKDVKNNWEEPPKVVEGNDATIKIHATCFRGGSLFIDARVQFTEHGLAIHCIDSTGKTRVMHSKRLPGPIRPEMSCFKIDKTGKDLTINLKKAEPVDSWKGCTIELYNPNKQSKTKDSFGSPDLDFL